jgi:DNA adenine methylase
LGFNSGFRKVLSNDINPHLGQLHRDIQKGRVTRAIADKYFDKEGQKLAKSVDGKHYYSIRQRFNDDDSKQKSLDFLFLTRCCFNGLLRFNKSGGFNTPWNKKSERFTDKRYKTLVLNQLQRVETIIHDNQYKFSTKDFRKIIPLATENDLLYLDPPYYGRHADYYTQWTEEDESDLFDLLSKTDAKFILSTWHHNEFRTNPMIEKYWERFHMDLKDHHFQLGGKRENRRPMVEALITNF